MLRSLIKLVPGIFLLILSANASAIDRAEAQKLYQQNCMACHGATGQPDAESAVIKGLGVVPANFQDALFASREPSDDFFLVIKFGGAAKGFSDKMPAFQGSLSDEQIEALVAYVKNIEGDQGYPSGDMNFILPIRSKKAFPEDEMVWKMSYSDNMNDRNRDQLRNVLELERRFLKNWQWSLEVRHSMDDGVDDGASNIDQVEPGIKATVYANAESQAIVSMGTLYALKTEERASSDEIIPFIAFAKGLSRVASFQGTARANLPVDGYRDGSMELSGVVHWMPSMWPRTLKPGIELVSSFPLTRGIGAGRKEFAQLSLIPQAQIGLNKRGHVALNIGAELPLNDTDRYDYRAYVYLLWDFADGGFTEGW